MITKFTLVFQGCYTLTDTDMHRIVDMLNDKYQGGTFQIDAQSIKKSSYWYESPYDRTLE